VLIQTPKTRWGRDEGISELIEHFNQPERYQKPEVLTSAEMRVIELEASKCRKDFSYASRNYFWIENRETREDIPFRLNEAQQLLLEIAMDIKSKGKSQRIMIIKSRQLGCCLGPETKVLTSDLRWIRIDDVQPGDTLVSVDENSPGFHKTRKFRKAVVEARRDVFEPAFKLVMDNGQELIATGEHRFLCRSRGAVHTKWMTVKKMRPGDNIRFIVQPWSSEQTYEDGWFAGLLDGEGSIRRRPNAGAELNVSQVEGSVLERAREYLESRGYTFGIDTDIRKSGTSSKLGNKPVIKFRICKMDHVFRLLGTTRPSRLMQKDYFEDVKLPKNGEARWPSVVSIEPLGERRMVDLQTSTKTFIAEGFVSHNSTLVQGLIAWRTFFFKNINSLVVSYSPEHSAYLFSLGLKMYDLLPWWLKPEYSSREFKTGLILDNPDVDDRQVNPGLNSKITVNWANAMTGVGQGYRLNAVHLSEFCDWSDGKAKKIIEEDVLNALHDGPETFIFLESTPKGAGRYAHKLWVNSEKLAERAMFTPVFLPWFFDKSHRVHVDIRWKPQKQEVEMRDKITRDWLRCSSALCRQFQRRNVYGRDYTDTPCPTCDGAGTLKVFTITDEQLAWMEHRRENAQTDEESLQILKQEQATTAEESFVLSGVKLFSDKSIDFATNSTAPPIADGWIDKHLKFHGMNLRTDKCWLDGCTVDHTYDTENAGLSIFAWPTQGATYVIGADVGEGIRKDYSVAQVLKVSTYGDSQVAVYARNDVDPHTFGEMLNKLGRFYNNALIATEVNVYDTAESTLRIHLNYPHCYVRKNIESENLVTSHFGWKTTPKTKPRLYQMLRKRLDMELVRIRDKFTVSELTMFRKDDDSDSMGAKVGFNDDRLMAFMIAEYVAHELDWDETSQIIQVRVPLSLDTAPWIFKCRNEQCGYRWPGSSAGEFGNCPKCFSMWVEAKSSVEVGAVIGGAPGEDYDPLDEDELASLLPAYDDL
jgi:hypothetical protein